MTTTDVAQPSARLRHRVSHLAEDTFEDCTSGGAALRCGQCLPTRSCPSSAQGTAEGHRRCYTHLVCEQQSLREKSTEKTADPHAKTPSQTASSRPPCLRHLCRRSCPPLPRLSQTSKGTQRSDWLRCSSLATHCPVQQPCPRLRSEPWLPEGSRHGKHGRACR
eukprot:6197227-Pleurochrysis_carterae.AAC.3